MNRIRVAINGFGRIGRTTARMILQNDAMQLVAVNDLSDAKTLAHLFKYDSIHGKYSGKVIAGDKMLEIEEHSVYLYASKDPSALPWKDLNIDVVIEATGVFRTKELAGKHIEAGAKKVILFCSRQKWRCERNSDWCQRKEFNR